MRLFIGLWLPGELHQTASQLLAQTQAVSSGWRWTKPANLHFTLKFLGETVPAAVAPLQERLELVAAATAPFRLRLGGLGVFPPRGLPRVLWLDSASGGAELVSLATKIEAACRQLGFSSEARPFQPHLTLARAAGPHPLWPLPLEVNCSPEAEVTSFSLIESTLQPAGPVYQTLQEFTFKG